MMDYIYHFNDNNIKLMDISIPTEIELSQLAQIDAHMEIIRIQVLYACQRFTSWELSLFNLSLIKLTQVHMLFF